MPIEGLTDQPQRFSEIGRLRKGAPKPENSNRPGKDLTYFRATFLEGEEQAAEMFEAEYGPEPREINIVLPFDTVDENLEAWNEAYVASALLHRCTGKQVVYAIDHETGEVLVQNGRSVETGEPVKCDGKPITHWTDKKGKDHPVYCEPHGRLRVIIPELRRLAFVTVLTTSTWDILNLSTQLEAVRDMNKGSLRGIPLVLKRRPYWKTTPSGRGGKKQRREMWLLSVEADPAWVDAQLTAMRMATLPNGEATLKLPPGVPDTNGEIIEAEAEELPFTDEPEGPVWDGQYPTTMAEVKEWAGKEPYCFGNGDIRRAVEKRLADEFGDPAPTPEDFKKEVGEGEAAVWFWEAVVMEYELRQAPEAEMEEIPF